MNIYKNKKSLMLFLLPAFALLGVYLFYPFVMNIINSFMSIKSLGETASNWNDPWYKNYLKMIEDPQILTSLKNTAIMIAVTIIGQVGIAMVLTLLVDNIGRGTHLLPNPVWRNHFERGAQYSDRI